MKKIKTINGIFITLCALFMAAAFSSCEVALGTALNLDPPTVVITEPAFMQNIKTNTLTIKGTANDLQEIVYLYVTVEKTKGTTWKKQIQSASGGWGSNARGTWEGEINAVRWSIEVPMDNATEGEYLISVGAENNVNNAGPVTQRRIIIDQSPPTVSVILPVLNTDDYLTASSYFNANYGLRDTTILDKLYNRSVNIQYEVKDDFSIDTLELILADNVGNEYYNKFTDNAAWSGTTTVLANEIKDSAENVVNDKKYLQILTKATDKAGNEKSQSHGWFIWWPQADYPWTEDIGDTADTTAANLKQVYPESVVYGQSYDNQGIKSVTYKVFSHNGTSYNTTAVDTSTKQNIPLQEGDDPSAFFSFNFKAPKTSGKYKIETVAEDIYGNQGADIFYFYVYETEVTGPLLQSYGGTPSGLYGLGAVINIFLNLRDPARISTGATLTLNVNKTSGTAMAVLDTATNGTNQLKFSYTVVAGDHVDVLKIISINYTGITKPDGTSLPPPNNLTTTKDLDFYTRIQISTDSPVLNNVTLSGTTLTLAFSKTIFKGTGNITLTQQGTLLAPAVMSKAEYSRFGGNSVLGNYYTAGINGTDSAGNPDTTEKYILNYSTNTNDGALITALTNNGAFKIDVPVASGAVTVNGSSLSIDLSETWGYSPRVKGVNYAVTYPQGIVRDSQNNQVVALTGTARTFNVTGVNAPVIRIQKNRGTVTNDAGTPGGIFGVGEPVIYWVKNAKISATPVSDGHEWVSTGELSIDLGAQVRFSTNGYDVTGIKENKTNFPSAEQDFTIQVTLTDNVNSNGQSLYNGGSTNNPGAWNDFAYGWYGQDLSNQNNTKTFWINPYKYKNITSISTQNQYLRFNNIYVDFDTVGASKLTQTQYDALTEQNKTGYLRVSKYASYETRYKYVLTSTQPTTAQVKIDCQTPSATIRYNTAVTTTSAYGGKFGLSNEAGHPVKPVVTMPTNSNMTSYSSPFNIGTASISDGLLYAVRAEATNSGSTATAYEKAARSVIRFNDITSAKNWSTLLDKADALSRELHLWLRGGDDLSGSSLTPGFPLSWSDHDFTGVRLMTKDGATNNWYWITWEVSTQAYFHFLAGTTSTATQAVNGPHDWGWSKNAWAFQHAEYPLYAGGSLLFSTATQVTHPATDSFEFYDTFSGSR